MIGSILQGVAGLAGTITDGIQGAQNLKYNKELNEKQLAFAREQFDYQKQADQRNFNYQQDLNKQIMQREDTAVQRSASDMKAAGLSKNLAAGQSSSASTMSGSNSSASGTTIPGQQVHSPELSKSLQNMNISKMIADTRLANATAKKAEEEAETESDHRDTKKDLMNAEKGYKNAQRNLIKSQATEQAYNNFLNRLYRIRSTDSLSDNNKFNLIKAAIGEAKWQFSKEGDLRQAFDFFMEKLKGLGIFPDEETRKKLEKEEKQVMEQLFNDYESFIKNDPGWNNLTEAEKRQLLGK